MRRLYRHENAWQVELLAQWLVQQGIAIERRNQFAAGAAGDLSPFDCWPELWVPEDQWTQASQLLQQFQQAGQAPDWYCRHCGERNPGAFDWCWHCGQAPS